MTRDAFRAPSAEPLVKEYLQAAAIVEFQHETARVGLLRFGRNRDFCMRKKLAQDVLPLPVFGEGMK